LDLLFQHLDDTLGAKLSVKFDSGNREHEVTFSGMSRKNGKFQRSFQEGIRRTGVGQTQPARL
jgi:hypothetical protein